MVLLMGGLNTILAEDGQGEGVGPPGAGAVRCRLLDGGNGI
jgi:hypothetical protein